MTESQFRFQNRRSLLAAAAAALTLLPGCFGSSSDPATPTQDTAACPAITGTPWVPSVAGAGASNHDDPSVQLIKSVQSNAAVPVTGLDQGLAGKIVSFTFDMSTDLGASGSIDLVAETTGYPLQGGGWPVLVSLNDGVNEWVNLPIGGAGQACYDSGFYNCSLVDSGGNKYCGARSACAPDPGGTLGSAYIGASASDRRAKWEQTNSIGNTDYLTNNLFPTCKWTSDSSTGLKCSFAQAPGNFFSSGKIRSGTGVTYTAQYVLLADQYSTVPSGKNAGIKLTVVRKKDQDQSVSGSRGAVDLNVVLVGSKNIQDSHTEKGKQNLNALLETVVSQYGTQNSSTANLRIGKITVYEWACPQGGDSWANPSADGVGALFSAGSRLVDSTSEGKALNIFLVSNISYSGTGTVVGVSGGIGGVAVNGTTMSGLVFSSFNKLASFNTSCSGASGDVCPPSSQDEAFGNMGGTIVHEMGHYLGLNHPSESDGTVHDRVPDTPQCSGLSSAGYISKGSCRTQAPCVSVCTGTYCPTELACQFNHVMWWQTKSFNGGAGDGNLFSPMSGDIINYSPYVQ